MGDPTPLGTAIPLQITGVEEWFEGLRAVWADKTTSTPVKIQRTLTNGVIMLAIFVLIAAIALIVMKLKGTGCKPCIETTTTDMPTSTEI